MPGTYLDSSGKVQYDPFSLKNALFPGFWYGQNLAFSHSERKILISIYTIFNFLSYNNIDSFKMTMVSQLPFCPACQKMIINFADIYGRNNLILGYEIDNIKTPRIFNTI